jgi:hypothetical protein
MTPQTISVALSAAFVLAGAAVSFVVLWRASVLLRSTPPPAPPRISDAAIDVLQQRLDALAEEVQELRQRPASISAPLAPRAAMNLDRRSQVLRMHRRGESPTQIAAALDIPLQEIDLLIKVHRIVLRTI